MKQEISGEEYCPHCKRHCSLKAPHCGKGRALAEERRKEAKKEAKKEKADLVWQEEEKTEFPPQAEYKLAGLLKSSLELMECGKKGKRSRKRLRLSLLSMAAEGEDIRFALPPENSEETLQKLEKKGYIRRDGESAGISLTDKGREKVKEFGKTESKEEAGIFSVLDEEEKDNLERILKKILYQKAL
ncbi:MAG: hypothetical protein QM683_05070 [Lacrimispora sp.]